MTIKNIANLPHHVAIIMDGNGRWAEKQGLPRLLGHRAGVENTRPIIKCLSEHGIGYATLYAFSTENWGRPEDEVRGLLSLLEEVIDEESDELHRNGVRIRHVGRLERLSKKLRKSIDRAEKMTEANTGLTLGVAFNYGGRAEILDAVRRIIAEGVPPQDVNEDLLQQHLYTADFPDVDLLIRTSGELRSSNFLIWQAAYSEYYFTPVLWPDFDAKCLEKALLDYSRRQRRFGRLQAGAVCSEKES